MATTEHEDSLKSEYRLARTLRDSYCDESGKEIDKAKTGEVLHKIGQVYRKRSPDKMSIIKSAGLFNAAIARNPSNIIQIESDLVEICKHILQQTNANDQNANLVEKAKEVKTLFNQLRKKVKDILKTSVPNISEKDTDEVLNKLKTNKVSVIRQINKTIANRYKQIMADLAQYCQNVMGEPPCQYAVIGMGSLSREEITPYSDFEHSILLIDDENYESYLNYFRWYSVIFHVIILNLQETIVPSLNVGCLNDKDSPLGDWYYDAITTRGISFDGMMAHACKFPLGRQQCTKNKPFVTELIKPVNKMLEYLSSEANLKNGYHLADILTKTCFVFGNEDIFTQFELGVRQYRDGKPQTEIIEDVQQQVKEDLNKFSMRFRLSKLKSQNQINIKQLVYRSTTVFMSALATIYNISSNSNFDILDEMTQSNKITRNSANELQYAIAIACEMRLRVYAEKNSQCDNAIDLKQNNKNIRKFVDIVGAASTIDYFQIAYCLQCEVAKQLRLKKIHFYSDPQIINITISLAFGLNDFAKIKLRKSQFWNTSQFQFDTSLKQLQAETQLNFSEIKRATLKYGVKEIKTLSIADSLYSAKLYDEALDFYLELLHVYQNKTETHKFDEIIAMINNHIGSCLSALDRYGDADAYLMKALQLQQQTTLNDGTDIIIAGMLCDVGECKMYLHQYSDSLKYLKESHKIYQSVSLNPTADRNVAVSLELIGYCLMKMQNSDEGLHYLSHSLAIYKRTTNDIAVDTIYAKVMNNIGYYLMDLHRFKDAMNYLKEAQEININTTLDVESDLRVAASLSNIGRCLIGLQQYDESWKCLEQSLKIKLNRTLDEEKDRRIAYNYNYMGECLMRMGKLADALNYLQRALKIYETITVAAEKDTTLANTLNLIGQCRLELQQYADALAYLKKSLEIYTNLPPSQHMNTVIELIRSKLEQCARLT